MIQVLVIHNRKYDNFEFTKIKVAKFDLLNCKEKYPFGDEYKELADNPAAMIFCDDDYSSITFVKQCHVK